MNDIVFCAVLMASMASANAESWPVEGTVKAPCAVAVSLKSPLHFYATRGTPDALAKELRVRDAKGTEVPYAIRKRMIQFEPAPPDESNFNCAPVHDAKAKKTIFELDTRFIPVEKVREIQQYRNHTEVRMSGVADLTEKGRITTENIFAYSWLQKGACKDKGWDDMNVAAIMSAAKEGEIPSCMSDVDRIAVLESIPTRNDRQEQELQRLLEKTGGQDHE